MTYKCFLCGDEFDHRHMPFVECLLSKVCSACASSYPSPRALRQAIRNKARGKDRSQELLDRPHGVNPAEDAEALDAFVEQSGAEAEALVSDANREMFGDDVADLIDLGILPDDIGDK